ncbi:hypothetical protein [Neobacillus drentensis]
MQTEKARSLGLNRSKWNALWGHGSVELGLPFLLRYLVIGYPENILLSA